MKKALFLLLFISIHFSLCFASQVIISGKDSTYAGFEITFYKYSDSFTKKIVELAKCKAAQDGSFTIEFSADEITYVVTKLGIYEGHLFAVPGEKYEIVLPPFQPKTPGDLLNPYFDATQIHLGTKNYNENELNTLIRMFNDAFLPYYSKHIEESNQHLDYSQLDKDIARMDKPFSSSKIKYFDEYRRYRYGLVRHLAFQQKTKSISAEYFKNQPLLLNNPAYLELFNKVYEKYFLHFTQTDEGKQLEKDISENNLDGMRKTLASDGVLGENDLSDLVLLKNLYDEFYKDNYSRNSLLSILKKYIEVAANEKLKEIAIAIQYKTTKLLAGFEPPEFILFDRDSNSVSLVSLRGKYVYINFCSCFSYTCMNEFSMLKTLHEKYKDKLAIVTILVDNDLDVLNSFLSRSNYPWLFLHYGSQPEIIQDYDIRAFPTYYLVDPQGKLILSPSPSPGEEFEGRWFKIMRERGEI